MITFGFDLSRRYCRIDEDLNNKMEGRKNNEFETRYITIF